MQREMEEKFRAMEEAMEASKKDLLKSKEDVERMEQQLKDSQVFDCLQKFVIICIKCV
jgi:flagellar motility protein MotE (MotC chaperone)